MRRPTTGDDGVGRVEVGVTGLGFMTFDRTGTQPREQLATELAGKHPAFAEVARARRVSPQQVAPARELARSPVVVPIPGAERPQSITDSAAAADLDRTAEELSALDRS
jgi:aryl-alcohol dehydrogenase-like predicted oxidoreductase